ncbi:hypothetical protein KC335_g82 [Hortaea werneckii]|nr:hypothetical protein KC335_g82 [Hortaea werneckii]
MSPSNKHPSLSDKLLCNGHLSSLSSLASSELEEQEAAEGDEGPEGELSGTEMTGMATYVRDDVVLDLSRQRDEAEEGGHVDLDREGFRGCGLLRRSEDRLRAVAVPERERLYVGKIGGNTLRLARRVMKLMVGHVCELAFTFTFESHMPINTPS